MGKLNLRDKTIFGGVKILSRMLEPLTVSIGVLRKMNQRELD